MSIKLSNIYHTYSKGTPFERLALNDVSLEISKGEIVAIIGHTGSGKSTLVQHLNGLLKPDKGSASIDDINITAKSRGQDCTPAGWHGISVSRASAVCGNCF